VWKLAVGNAARSASRLGFAAALTSYSRRMSGRAASIISTTSATRGSSTTQRRCVEVADDALLTYWRVLHV